MASCITSYWDANSSTPRVRLTVTQTSETDTSVTLSWKLEYIASYAVSTSVKHDCTATINGSSVYDGSYAISGKTGTNTIASGTKSVSKGSSAKTVAFSCSMDFSGITWSGKYNGSNKTASGTISIDAKEIQYYTISYNANGGSGAPSSQTKTHGVNLTLSSAVPSRSGYSFAGWGTSSSDTSSNYNPGDTYTSNSSITLYAIWSAKGYVVAYNANGGTGAPSNQSKQHGQTLTLSNTVPSRTNYTFLGWGLTSGSTSVSYDPGDSYTANSSVTLYAIWSLSYTKPRITGVNVYRANDNGSSDDSGTRLRVSFSWATDKNVSSVKIEWKTTDGIAWTTYTLTSTEATGKSGSVDKFFSDHEFSTDSSYTIQITVSDASGNTYTSRMISGTVFPIDVLPQNKGIAFGKPAELEDYMDVGYNTLFRHESLSYHDDTAYVHVHEKTNLRVGFGVGSGGNNHGIYSSKISRWTIYTDENGETRIGNIKGYVKPYFGPGDSMTISIRTGGYCTNGSTYVLFTVPLSKPLLGVTTATVSTGSGLILRSNGQYSHGSGAEVRVYPSSYTTYTTTAGFLSICAVFVDVTNATNNCAIGVDANITITFS